MSNRMAKWILWGRSMAAKFCMQLTWKPITGYFVGMSKGLVFSALLPSTGINQLLNHTLTFSSVYF